MVLERVDIASLPVFGSPFQSGFWATVKQSVGWKPFAFTVTIDDCSTSLLVLVREFAFSLRLAYVPFGPDLASCPAFTERGCLDELSREIAHRLPRRVFAIRYDFPWDEGNVSPSIFNLGPRFRVLDESIQPDGTVRLDLSGGYRQVASGYRQRTRRALRKSSDSIEIVEWDGSDVEFDRWYDVYRQTADRDGFSPRSRSYLRRMLDLSEMQRVCCRLLVAHDEGRTIGGIMVLFSRWEAVYLFGASLREKGCSCSPALQDHAIGLACASGCRVYDLFGIPGREGRGEHLKSLELFKRSFGGAAVYRLPSMDYVIHGVVWKVFTLFERFRYDRCRRRATRRPRS